MRPAVLLAALLGLPLLAGCSSPEAPAAPAQPVVEGWVVDARLAPVVGIVVTAVGLGANGTTDGEGHFAFGVPAGVDVLVVAEGHGFLPQSRSVSAGSGERILVNFTLERAPVADPYLAVESFDGILRCGVVAVVLEDPSRPHTHSGVRCSAVTEDDTNVWAYQVPGNTTGLVIEAVWEAQSDLSRSMLLNVSVQATGEVLGFQEGISPLRAQTSRFKLDLERAAGNDVLDIRVEAGAGTGNHEHGAVGATVEQAFRLFVTSFYNAPVDPGYSITQG
jgi:hypothetical protein